MTSLDTPCRPSRHNSLVGSPYAASSYTAASTYTLPSTYSPSAVSLASEPPVRPLEAGACVCLYTSLGELVTVKQHGKVWELHAVIASDDRGSEGGVRLPYFPPEAVFLVIRKGSRVGFRSLGADGRTLQAVKSPECPHQVANYNFGGWESWELTPSGYFNVQWQKRLGLDVQEVRIVALDDIRRVEKQLLHSSRASHAQLRSLEHKLADSDRRLRDMVKASQRQSNSAANEMAELRRRLEEAQSGRAKADADAGRKAAALKQLELRLADLSAEQEGAEHALESAGRRIEELEAELSSVRERARQQLENLQHGHARELMQVRSCTQQDQRRAVDDVEREVKDVRLQLDKVVLQKDTELQRVQDKAERELHFKDMEINALLDERERLDAALQSIKGHLDKAAHSSPMHANNLRMSVDPLTLRSLRKALGDADQNMLPKAPVACSDASFGAFRPSDGTDENSIYSQAPVNASRRPMAASSSAKLGLPMSCDADARRTRPSLYDLLSADAHLGSSVDTPRMDIRAPGSVKAARDQDSADPPCEGDDEITLAGSLVTDQGAAAAQQNTQEATSREVKPEHAALDDRAAALEGCGGTSCTSAFPQAGSPSPYRRLDLPTPEYHPHWLPPSPTESLASEESFRRRSRFLLRKPLPEMA